MNDNSLRLPGIASLVSPTPWASVQPPPVDGSVVCFTLPAGPSPLDSQWTAINRQASSNRPTPGSSNGVSTATDAHVLSSSGSLAPSPPESGRHVQSTHRQQTSNSTRFTASLHSPQRASQSSRHSPARDLQRASATAPRPITSRRQDPAVPELPVLSQASTTLQDAPSFSSAYLESIPAPSRRSSVARVAAADPETPPPPTLCTNTRHDRRLASPPETLKNELKTTIAPTRTGAHSDSKRSPLLHPTTFAYFPVHIKTIESPTRGSMLPPPNPVSATPVSAFIPQSPSNGSASILYSAAAPIHRSQATKPDGRSIDQLGISPSIQTAGASNSPQGYTPDLAVTMPSHHPDSDASTRCVNCNDVWTYPPIDIDPSMRPAPSKTLEELNTQTLGVTDLMNQYNRNKTKSYQVWMRRHQSEPGHPDSTSPCMLVRRDPTEGTSVSNKRRSGVFLDNGHMSPKLRRLSYNSPPRNLQLTPPPDRPLSSSPPHHSGNFNVKYRCETPAGGIEVDEHIAIIIGVKRARSPYPEPSPKDATSMWTLPEQRNKSVEREKDRSASPVI